MGLTRLYKSANIHTYTKVYKCAYKCNKSLLLGLSVFAYLLLFMLMLWFLFAVDVPIKVSLSLCLLFYGIIID